MSELATRAQSADIYRAFFDSAPDAVVAVDAEGRIVDANAQVTVLFGYERDNLLGQTIEILLPARYRAGHTRHRSGYAAHPAARPMGAGLDLRGRHREGMEFPVDVSLSPAVVNGERLTLAAIRDVTARHRSDRELRASERRFRMVFEDAPFGMAMVDRQQRLRQVNEALCRLLGRGAAELTASTVGDLTPDEDSTRYGDLLDQLFDGRLPHFTIEKRFQTGNGRVVWAEVTFSALGAMAHDDALAVAMIEDITTRKETEARLTHLATHDELTGLANRSLLGDRLRQAQARSARSGKYFAVLFLDLDDFKPVNDDLGHRVGDAVLAEVGRRIRATVRPVDTAARHGGDEFVVCCEDLADSEVTARAAADRVIARLVSSIGQPIEAAGQTVTITACIGVMLARGGGPTPEGLIAEADAAMYRAKRVGKGRSAYAGDRE